MHKDSKRTCVAIVLLIKPFVWWRSRRRRRRCLLKLPTNFKRTLISSPRFSEAIRVLNSDWLSDSTMNGDGLYFSHVKNAIRKPDWTYRFFHMWKYSAYRILFARFIALNSRCIYNKSHFDLFYTTISTSKKMFFFRARAKKVIASFIAWHIDASSVVWTLKDFCFSNVLMLCYKLFNHGHLNAPNKHFKDINLFTTPQSCAAHNLSQISTYSQAFYHELPSLIGNATR